MRKHLKEYSSDQPGAAAGSQNSFGHIVTRPPVWLQPLPGLMMFVTTKLMPFSRAKRGRVCTIFLLPLRHPTPPASSPSVGRHAARVSLIRLPLLSPSRGAAHPRRCTVHVGVCWLPVLLRCCKHIQNDICCHFEDITQALQQGLSSLSDRRNFNQKFVRDGRLRAGGCKSG